MGRALKRALAEHQGKNQIQEAWCSASMTSASQRSNNSVAHGSGVLKQNSDVTTSGLSTTCFASCTSLALLS